MSSIEISSGQFPQAIPNHVAVGDYVKLTVMARVRKIEEDEIDVSTFPRGGRAQTEVLPGERTATFTVLEVGVEKCGVPGGGPRRTHGA